MKRRVFLLCALGSAFLAASWSLASAGAGIRADIPSQADIAVAISGGPPKIGSIPADGMQNGCNLPSSTAQPPFTIDCPFTYAYRESGVALNGTATWTSKGKQGTFAMVCDFDVSISGKVTVDVSATGTTGDPAFEFSGSGTQPCSWNMDFGGGTTLSGTLDGHATFGLVDASTGFFKGDFAVNVVSGTGDLNRAVGSGSFTEYQEFPFGGKTPPGGLDIPTIPSGAGSSGGATTGPPSNIPTGGIRLPASALAAPKSSSMTLHLKAGAPRVSFVLPPHVSAKGSYALHLVTAPSSSCIASAVLGAKKVDLGHASATKKSGSVIFAGRLGAKLGIGTWKLSASCSLSGATVSAKATTKVVA